MKIKYNAPVTLTFSLVCAVVLLISKYLTRDALINTWFAVGGGFDFGSFRSYVTLFTHVIGHADWGHLFGNISLILLLGPLLEQSYGSLTTLMMIAVTALITGILHSFMGGLYGASGIVFMMILLSSFTNFSKGEIPLTFILVTILYLGQQVWQAIAAQNHISEFAHIIGGFCGSLFGFLRPAKR